MTTDQILARLPATALLLEPREVYDPCIVAMTDRPDDHWPRKSQQVVVVYDREKCIEAIAKWQECDEDAATEWFDFNTSGGWNGEGTPTFRSMFDQLEEPLFV